MADPPGAARIALEARPRAGAADDRARDELLSRLAAILRDAPARDQPGGGDPRAALETLRRAVDIAEVRRQALDAAPDPEAEAAEGNGSDALAVQEERLRALLARLREEHRFEIRLLTQPLDAPAESGILPRLGVPEES